MSADIDVGYMSTPDKLGVVLNPNQSFVVMDAIVVSTYLPGDIMLCSTQLIHTVALHSSGSPSITKHDSAIMLPGHWTTEKTKSLAGIRKDA